MMENKGFRAFIKVASIATLIFISPFSLMATFMIMLGMVPPGGVFLAIVFAVGTLLVTVSAIVNLTRLNKYSVIGLFVGALIWYLGIH